jgi:hypothetical protein
MAKQRSSAPAWSDVKSRAASLDQQQLVKLVADLYRLSKENRDFLNVRFAGDDDCLKPYKKVICECMYPDVMKNQPIQISKAKRAISNYSQAAGDPIGEVELMTYFVECGNSFTVNYGDIDTEFYEAINRMYKRAIDKVLNLSEEQREGFRERLAEIMNSSKDIGWGYHDALCDDYHEAFPADE